MAHFFGDKVRLMRKKKGLTQAALAQQVGLARHTHINHIEANRRSPSLQLVLRISQVLGVTTDYLVRDSIPVTSTLGAAPISPLLGVPPRLFSAKLRYLRIRRGITQSELTQQLGLSSQGYISKLEAGRKEPSPDLVVQIAELFGVTTEDLLSDDIAVPTLKKIEQ
jgi:transcriptional regulator with XRE-family HTH domain